MPVETPCPYESDFLHWAQEQASLLREAARQRINYPLDWDNLAEEIEGLGRSERRELRNRLDTVIEHLLKLQHARALEPRRGWEETVTRERRRIEALLSDNPSLRKEVPDLVARLYPTIGESVAAMLARRGEGDAGVAVLVRTSAYTEAEVLGPWLPDPPAAS
jgi:Domain of unknown function DUF29